MFSVYRLFAGLFCVLMLGLPQAPIASAQSPTPQQLQQLRQLSPDQRRQLARYLDPQGSATRTSSSAVPSVGSGDALAGGDTLEETEEEDEGIAPGNSVVIDLQPPPDLEEEPLLDLREAAGRTMYRVDDYGNIDFPGVGTVMLRGLTEEQAQLRLSSEEVLKDYSISVYLLPLEPTGVGALEHFGYELFESNSKAFTPAGNMPVPADYVMGPGDTVILGLYGNQNGEYRLEIDRDGQLNLPDIGPVSASGLTFDALRNEVVTRITEQVIGVRVTLSLDELRSIRVFVVGDVERPGAYFVPASSTMLNALFESGGVDVHGSLRDIRLVRGERVTGSLDLYDLLLRGRTKGDRVLQAGDVVFVPTVGDRVAISGQVKRPAIYELDGERTVADILDLAGGKLPSAYDSQASIERFAAGGNRTIVTFDTARAASFAVQSGDAISIDEILSEYRNVVWLKGFVERSGPVQMQPNMRLTDLIRDPLQLRSGVDMDYVLIRREVGAERRIQLLSANLSAALAARGTAADPALTPGDEVYVLELASDRAEIIKPLIEELRSQSSLADVSPIVSITGQVRAPGEYPIEPGMRVSDLIRAAGKLSENAFLAEAELTRYTLSSGRGRETQHFPVRLADALNGDETADVLLEPYDYLTIKEVPQWESREVVEITGEVRFPGKYAIRRGERLSSVLERAGGLTPLAFPEGSVFLREDLRKREEERLSTLADRMEREIASLDAERVESRQRAQGLLAKLRETRAQGRLVFELNSLLENPDNENFDLLLRDGDKLLIPRQSQEVTVLGEVQYPTSHLFEPGLDRSAYIEKSGGLSANADNRRIYIVRANGNVVTQSPSGWFRGSRGTLAVQPGDTVVVPLDADSISTLSLWTSVSTVIYNVGVAAAAVGSF